MRYEIVMTCSYDIWREHGCRAAGSVLDHWPVYSDARLHLVVDDFEPDQRFLAAQVDDRVTIHTTPQWYRDFKERHATNLDARGRATRGKLYDFRRDCIRFGHKPAALTTVAERLDDGILVMMDADVITHKPVTTAWLRELLPSAYDLSWLNRPSTYPECGFVMFRLERCRSMLRSLRHVYEQDAVFRYPETHDSYVLAQLVRGAGLAAHDLVDRGGARSGHPFVHSPLAERLDHLKGKRKAAGKTPASEVPEKRRGDYWK
jgi:hypothetical protein